MSNLQSGHLNQESVDQLNREFEEKEPQEILKWAYGRFSNRMTLACSFSVEDNVLIDMLSKIDLNFSSFFLDTGRMNQETYDLFEKVREKYKIKIDVYFPNQKAEENLMTNKGPISFYKSKENRLECCHIRKVEPIGRALKDKKSWITGLRREQAPSRANLTPFEIDETHGGILKINPLIKWTHDQVWDYIHEYQVPYNKLYDMGYTSIGCAPCTRAVEPGEKDIRAGRWWWENPEQKECGLHTHKKGK